MSNGSTAFGKALAAETENFGIKVPLIEPTACGTDFTMPSPKKGDREEQAYADVRKQTEEAFKQMTPGNPGRTAPVILQRANTDEPPLRIILGERVPEMIGQTHQSKIVE